MVMNANKLEIKIYKISECFLTLPPTWRRDFVLSLVMSLHPHITYTLSGKNWPALNSVLPVSDHCEAATNFRFRSWQLQRIVKHAAFEPISQLDV